VKDKIEAALLRSASLDAEDIRVETHNGTVTLNGTVHSWDEKIAAEDAAWAAPGVTQVYNHLSIRY
jgi:osmotically-inducible protein OsmY